MLFGLVLAFHVIVGLAIIGLVLLQHGKGADMGAAFGSGSSGSLFGASGSANFLSRATAVLAAVFFVTSLGLSYIAGSKHEDGGGVMESVGAAPAAGTAKSDGTGAKDAPAPGADSKAKDIPK